MQHLGRAVIFLLAPCAAVFAASLPGAGVSAKTAPTILEQGELGGARFTVARAAQWNRRLLLLAHGARPESAPLLADLSPESFACKTLLDEGWIVAKTSFRRNGIILADAIADLDALRAHIVDQYGTPDRVLLEGESMGGLIVTLMAEREPEVLTTVSRAYDGAVAIGAALEVREPNTTVGLTLQPRIPLVFLTNQSELEGPRLYAAPKNPPDNLDLRPVVFRISRNGHGNVSQRERLAALRSLNAWLDHGRATLPQPGEGQPFFDATLPLEPRPSQVTLHADGRGFDARITDVSAIYGNVAINAQPEDFAAAGIKP